MWCSIVSPAVYNGLWYWLSRMKMHEQIKKVRTIPVLFQNSNLKIVTIPLLENW